jgi:hypothetical protein
MRNKDNQKEYLKKVDNDELKDFVCPVCEVIVIQPTWTEDYCQMYLDCIAKEEEENP